MGNELAEFANSGRHHTGSAIIVAVKRVYLGYLANYAAAMVTSLANKFLRLQWSHVASRCPAETRPRPGQGGWRWLSIDWTIWRRSRGSRPAIFAPTASADCWTRRGGSADRRTTTTI